ncbi:hypothetical protein A8950_0131 [Dongia mobilis]|uniref:Uncharacterized protein n=1 Tax=Dongia mobilis TaxID=578943 RepID=A0A4R6WT86_9PROT|nr:hypothetical protein [Dongia mobilis]TDQ86439.1 hypothetical protein A8950_0131 [Dongia mobilis]
MRVLVPAFAVLALAACQPQHGRVHLAEDEKIQIAKGVWDSFEEYKRLMGRGGGAFAVTEDGLGSAYSYCPADRCLPGSMTQSAIELCEGAGVKCVIFAQGTSIKVDYDVID